MARSQGTATTELTMNAAGPAISEARQPSLRRNFSWAFAGNVIYAACQWGMVVVLAKLGSPEMLGRFTLGVAITGPIIMFTNLQLREIQATDVRGEYAFADYLGLRLIMTTVALLLVMGITLASGYGGETAIVVLLVGLAKSFEAVTDVIFGLLQQRERMDRIARSMIIKGIISLLALGLLVAALDNVAWGAVGMAATWAMLLFVYDLPNARMVLAESAGRRGYGSGYGRLKPRWEPKTLLRIAWTALPLGIMMMLISLDTNIPRYFVEHQLGTRELGIFSAMAYIVVAGYTVVNALGQSAIPRLARYYAAGMTREFRNLLARLVGIGLALGTAGMLTSMVGGRWLLGILYTNEYSAYSDVFTLLMVAAAVLYMASFLSYGMIAAQQFNSQAPLMSIVCLATFVGSWVFVNGEGLRGAAIALLLSAGIRLVGSVWIVVRAVRRREPGT